MLSACRRPQPHSHLPAPRAPEVLSEARQHTLPSGLVFVPTHVRALGGMPSRDTLHRLILDAYKDERLELQPESGLARLSKELALCIPGPQDSPLCWARVLDPEGVRRGRHG